MRLKDFPCRFKECADQIIILGDFRGKYHPEKFAGGDDITVLPSGEKATVKEIYEGDKKVNQSSKGHGVTIQLDSEIDISRRMYYREKLQSFVWNEFLNLYIVDGRQKTS